MQHETLVAGAKEVDSALLGLSEVPRKPITACSAAGENCGATKCCSVAGMQCYQKNSTWATCREDCTVTIDDSEQPGHRAGWSCLPLGSRAPSSAASRQGTLEGASTVQVTVSVNASGLPSDWASGQSVLIGPAGHQIRGTIVDVAGELGAQSASSGSVGAAWWRCGLALMVAISLAAAASRKLRAWLSAWWQKSSSDCKTNLPLGKAPPSGAHPLSEHLKPSPVRRRRSDGGTSQAPADASASHGRWPSDVSVASTVMSPHVPNTPGRWPLMSKP